LSLFGLRPRPRSGTFSFVRPNMYSMPGEVNVRSRVRTNGISEPNQPHCAGGGLGLSIRQRAALRGQEDMLMAWTTPTLVEICLGLEINGYLPAEF
jgi:coenzyme PQQ precursor peptide PqqA